MKLDKIHYSFRSIEKLNKSFNVIISAREAGKSQYFDLKRHIKNLKKMNKQ